MDKKVAIVDGMGTEDVDAIADFDLERFPGTTKRLTISFGTCSAASGGNYVR